MKAERDWIIVASHSNKRRHKVSDLIANLPGYYGFSDGLFLQVTIGKTGNVRRSWILRYTSPVSKRVREMGLGSFKDITLVAARKLAGKARAQIKSGIDPIAARRSLDFYKSQAK